MSTQTFQVRADTRVPVDLSVFGLRAFGDETRFETDLGTLPAKLLTKQHRLRTLKGPHVGIEWIERLDLDPDTLSRCLCNSDISLLNRPGSSICHRGFHDQGSKIWRDRYDEVFWVRMEIIARIGR